MIRLLSLGILLLYTQTLRAQDERPKCPSAQADASAERQAKCWFERTQNSPKECVADKDGNNPCELHAVAWCADAVFDDPDSATTCFLAHVHTRQFEQAKSVRRYLNNPTEAVSNCGKALEAVRVKFVSVPDSAEILVDGYSYGKSPIEVELRGEWWNSKVVAIFDDGVKAKEVKVPSKDITAAFDRQKCVMAQVSIQGPDNTPMPEILPLESVPTDADAEAQNSKPFPVTAVVSLSLGGAGLVTGGILIAMAASRASYLRSLNEGTTWTLCLENKDKSLSPLSIGGGIALAVGAALATAGIVLLTTDDENASSQSAAGEGASTSLGLNGQGIQWLGRF
jgi:hypothetical protein